MATKSPKPKVKSKTTKPAQVELEPDAMQRFERAMGVMVPVRRKKAGKK